MSAEAAADGMRMAGDAADLLLGNRPGLLLIGPERQTRAVVRLVLDRLASWPIIPVLFAAPGASRVALRDAVGQAHATKSDPKASLLLVIEEADQLSPALLSELEQAAGAAAEYGGLQFLLAGQQDLAPTLQRDGRAALSKCLRTRLSVRAPVLPVEPRGAPPGIVAPERRDPVAATRSRPGRRILQTGALLTGCVAIAGLAAVAYLHDAPPRLMPQETLSTPNALLRSGEPAPAQVARLTDPPIPPSGSAAPAQQPPSPLPDAPPPPQAAPAPAVPEASPAPAPAQAEVAQNDSTPPPPPTPPPADVAAQPAAAPVPDQTVAAAPTPPVTNTAGVPASTVQPDQPATGHEVTPPAPPAGLADQPHATLPAASPAPSTPDIVATDLPPVAATPVQPVIPPEGPAQAADRPPQGGPAAPASSVQASASPPLAAAAESPSAPQPPQPPAPPSSPAVPDQLQQAPAVQPADPVATPASPAGSPPHDPPALAPAAPAAPTAPVVPPPRLPALRPAGSPAGPPSLTTSPAAQPQGLPAPQQQAMLLQPLPSSRMPLRVPPRTPQPVPRSPAGASLLLLAGPNDTLRSLYREVYRGVLPPRFETVAALNPVAVRPGTRLIFPAPPEGWPAPHRSRR